MHCDAVVEVVVPKFSGNSYLQFDGLSRSVLRFYSVEIVFLPTSDSGLLLYNGYSTDRAGDFVSLTLRDGFVECCFDLGTGAAVIRYLTAPLILHLLLVMIQCATEVSKF